MKTTIFKCDKCGAEDTTNKIDILNVGIHVGGFWEKYHSGRRPEIRLQIDKEWCKECRIKAGLAELPKDSTIHVEPITLEDIVREIAYDAACDAISNGR